VGDVNPQGNEGGGGGMVRTVAGRATENTITPVAAWQFGGMGGGGGAAGGVRGDGLQQVYHTFELFGQQIEITLEKLLMLLLVFFLGGAQMAFAAVALFVLVTYFNSQKQGGGGGGRAAGAGRAGN